MVGVILDNHTNLQMVAQGVSIKGEPFKTYNAIIIFSFRQEPSTLEKFKAWWLNHGSDISLTFFPFIGSMSLCSGTILPLDPLIVSGLMPLSYALTPGLYLPITTPAPIGISGRARLYLEPHTLVPYTEVSNPQFSPILFKFLLALALTLGCINIRSNINRIGSHAEFWLLPEIEKAYARASTTCLFLFILLFLLR